VAAQVADSHVPLVLPQQMAANAKAERKPEAKVDKAVNARNKRRKNVNAA